MISEYTVRPFVSRGFSSRRARRWSGESALEARYAVRVVVVICSRVRAGRTEERLATWLIFRRKLRFDSRRALAGHKIVFMRE